MRRFINADIVAGSISEAVTLNRYAYANGNPVSNIDPFGLSAERQELSQEEFKKVSRIMENAYIAAKRYFLLRKIKNAIQSGLKIPISSFEYNITLGNARHYLEISHTFGEGKIDIGELQEILEGQFEVYDSYNFANGKFDAKYSSDGSVSVAYSAQIDDYNTLTTSISLGLSGSYSVEHELETILKEFEGHSVTTTFGTEMKYTDNDSNNQSVSEYVPEVVPEVVPSIVSPEPEIKWYHILFFEGVKLLERNMRMRRAIANAMDDLGKAIEQSFVDFFDVPLPIPGPFPIPIA